MGTFSAHAQKDKTAPRIVTLSPNAFADTWTQKPDADVAIGLRLLSEGDLQTAKTEAARQAIGWYDAGDDKDNACIDEEARTDAYNDALVRFAIARATCDPNDRTKPYFDLAEETVRFALTSEGVARLWDEIVRFQTGTGVTFEPSSDEELVRLSKLLRRPKLLKMLPRGAEKEVRKLLAYCLETIAAAAGEHASVPEEEEEDEMPTYTARIR